MFVGILFARVATEGRLVIDLGFGTSAGALWLTGANIVLSALTSYLVARGANKRDRRNQLDESYRNVLENLHTLVGIDVNASAHDDTLAKVSVALKMERGNVYGCFRSQGKHRQDFIEDNPRDLVDQIIRWLDARNFIIEQAEFFEKVYATSAVELSKNIRDWAIALIRDLEDEWQRNTSSRKQQRRSRS